MKKLILALVILGVAAMPAFAAVQNIKVSGDVESTWVLRNNFHLGGSYDDGVGLPTGDNLRQNLFFTTTRLGVDADLTDNVSAVIRLINERVWGNVGSNSNTDIELEMAYVELREMLYSPLTLTIGRQPIYYGNGLILGMGPNNVADTSLASSVADLSGANFGFDGIKAVLNYDPLTIDMFMAKIDSGSNTFHKLNKADDADLYGVVANYTLADDWNTGIESYFITFTNQYPQDVRSDKIYIPGVRVSTNPMEGLALSAEVAMQYGKNQIVDPLAPNDDNLVDRNALAAQLIASWLLPIEELEQYNPVLSFAYTYASGDKDIRSNTARTTTQGWNPMFEDVAGGKIYNAIFPLSNVHTYEVALHANLAEDLRVTGTYTGLWLARKWDQPSLVLDMPDGNESTLTVDTGKSFLGYELDVDLMYDYTEDVCIGLSAGWFVPGSVFTSVNDKVASQLLLKAGVSF